MLFSILFIYFSTASSLEFQNYSSIIISPLQNKFQTTKQKRKRKRYLIWLRVRFIKRTSKQNRRKYVKRSAYELRFVLLLCVETISNQRAKRSFFKKKKLFSRISLIRKYCLFSLIQIGHSKGRFRLI